MKDDLHTLKPFFEPHSVALIGATRKFGFGYGQTKALLAQGFGEGLFFVNPSERELNGKRVYGKVSEIPAPIDLAILMVPARVCPETLSQCANKGAKCAIVLAAGFAEIGAAGRELQAQMTQIAHQKGIRVLGPNCIGLVNTKRGFYTAELLPEALRPGHIGVIAQSGVFGNILLDWAPEQGIRFSKVITIGNRCDVDETELVRYLAEDEQTRVIALYLEGFKDARRATAVFRQASGKKPILVLKSGRTEPGRAATLSHTGSLSGDDTLYAAAFKQGGLLRFRDMYELLDAAKAFATQPLPPGKRVAIITTSGSLGAMTVDVCSDLGLEIAALSKATIRGLSAFSPPWMNIQNPLDLGPSGLLLEGIQHVMADPGVDAAIAIFVIPYAVVEEIRRSGMGVERFFDLFREISRVSNDKPILFATLANAAFRKTLMELLGEEIPLMSTPESAAKALWALHAYGLLTGRTTL